jgi:hypothetical protein
MITRSDDTIRRHRVVQLVVVGNLAQADRSERLGAVLKIVNSSMAKPYTTQGHTTGSEAFALSVAAQAEEFPELAEPMAELIYTVGRNYEAGAEVYLSVSILERTLRLFEQQYGEDHPRVSAVLMNLGIALTKIGEVRNPEMTIRGCECLRRALHIAKANDLSVLGPHGELLPGIIEGNLNRCCRPPEKE